jgi:hypothetical protein
MSVNSKTQDACADTYRGSEQAIAIGQSREVLGVLHHRNICESAFYDCVQLIVNNTISKPTITEEQLVSECRRL